jgi:peptide/nickel transport system substrate-binding protein
MVVAKEVVEQFGDLKKWESAIGTGPFMLEKYVPNEVCRYVRHPEYYEKDRPYVDEVNWRIIPQREVILANFRTKQLDMCTGYIEYDDLMEMLKQQPENKWCVHHSNSWARLTFNTQKAPFNDKRVRQAASMCIDRDLQNQIVYDGRAKVDHVLTRAMWGSLPLDQLGEASKYFLPNKEEAKKLVKAAGYKTPLEVRLAYTPVYGAEWNSGAEALFGQLNSSGVFKVKVISKEYGAYISTNYIGKYDEECFYALTTPPSDPDEVLWDMYHSTSGRNSCKVKDPNLDKLLEAQRRELDENKRLAMLKDIQYYLAEQMYICPIIAGPVYDVWYPYLKGYNRHIVPAYNVGDRFRLVWLDK